MSLQPQHQGNRDQLHLPLQGAQQGPAAFTARESTEHALCTNAGLLPDKKNKPRCIYDAQTALSAGGIWHVLF